MRNVRPTTGYEMRPLALELFFGSATEQRLASVWSELSALYDRSADSELGVQPHLTLAVFRESPPTDLVGVGASLAARLSPFDLDLERVDRFPGDEGVVFLAPGPSRELTAAHGRVGALLGKDRELVDPYYRPAAWQPHCTMAINVPEARMNAVISACSSSEALGVATVTQVQVVRYRPATQEWASTLSPHRAV